MKGARDHAAACGQVLPAYHVKCLFVAGLTVCCWFKRHWSNEVGVGGIDGKALGRMRWLALANITPDSSSSKMSGPCHDLHV